MLERLSKDHFKHLLISRVRHAGDAGPPPVYETSLMLEIAGDDFCLGHRARLHRRKFRKGPTKLDDGVSHPLQMRFLTGNDVLVRIVEVILPDMAGRRQVILGEAKPVAIKLVK
jgi:hypothetical protein